MCRRFGTGLKTTLLLLVLLLSVSSLSADTPKVEEMTDLQLAEIVMLENERLTSSLQEVSGQLTLARSSLEIAKEDLKRLNNTLELQRIQLRNFKEEADSLNKLATRYEGDLLKAKRVNKYLYPIVAITSFLCGGVLAFTILH